MRIFDTHCDTVTEMYDLGLDFDNGRTHVSKDQIKGYGLYEQMFAIWSSPARSPEKNWDRYLKIRDFYREKILPFGDERFIPHLSVEGADMLNLDISRLDVLSSDGVRIIAPVWKGECCIGGAHDTNVGLTPFGREAVKKMCLLGILPDVSHSSDRMAYEIFEISDEYSTPVCASHSDSRSVRNHTRNLTDDMFLQIRKMGGVVGLNYCPEHLVDTDVSKADLCSVIRHIEHYLSLGGEDTVCLGCDFDGIEQLPEGVSGAGSHGALYRELKKINYSDGLIEKIFYLNAAGLFNKNQPDKRTKK